MTISPEKLRAVAAAGHPTVLMPAEGSMLADAMEIADDAAWCAIQNNTASHGEFHDITDYDPLDRDWIEESVRYLDARQLLARHPENPCWVTIKEPE